MLPEGTRVASPSRTPLLVATGVTKRFGGVTAVSNVNLELSRGEILGLVGPNGAGKTTLFNVLTGFTATTSGTVIWNGYDITRSSPHTIAALGLVRTFQHARVFPSLSVRENVLIGCHLDVLGRARGHVAALLRTPAYKRREKDAAQAADGILEEMGLSDRRSARAVDLTFGEARKLGVAIAAVRNPAALLLDEPAAGLNATESAGLVTALRRLASRGVSLLIVEHDMRVIMGVSDRLVVLQYGAKIFDGTPEDAQTNPEVLAAYLGVEEER